MGLTLTEWLVTAVVILAAGYVILLFNWDGLRVPVMDRFKRTVDRTKQISPLRWLLFAGVFLWLVFVWPTPWHYYKSGSTNYRVNRFTGTTQSLSRSGWHETQ